MQDAQRVILLFRLGYRITITAVVLFFLACPMCAQNIPGQKECETLFSAAAQAERQNDPIEAEFRYEECRELAQKYHLPRMEAAAQHRLAVIKARNKKFSESASLFRHALELDPKNALILCDFAQLHADRKDYDEAEKLLKKALDADSNNPKILFSLGGIIASQRAERQMEGLRYLKLAVGEAEAYRELARICRSKGDISRAEFADQKAKLAESQEPSSVSAATPSGNNIPAVRLTEPVQTPPAVVERVRQELLEINMREAVGAQQRSATPVVPPMETAAVPVADPQPDSSVPPIDPFITMVHPQELAASPVRILELPSASTYTQTAVRTIPGTSESLSAESLPAVPSSKQNSTPNSFAPVQAAVNDPIANNPTSNDLPSQRVDIISSDIVIVNSPQPSRSPVSDVSNQQATDLSLRVLPSDTKSVEREGASNPLRQIPLVNSMPPANDDSILASLPYSSIKGSRKIPRTDQNTIQEHAANVPQKTESQSSVRSGERISSETAPTAKPAEVAHTIRHLPVRDDRILQAPPAGAPRRESRLDNRPVSTPLSANNVPHVARVDSESSASVTSGSKATKVNQSNRQFLTANAPNIVGFGPSIRNQPTAVSPTDSAEVAVKPLTQNDSTQVTSADPSQEVIPLPLVAEVKNAEPQMPLVLQPEPVVADPFAIASVDSQPKVAEIVKVEPQTQQTPSAQQPEPKPVIADPFAKVVPLPLVAEVKKVEPQIAQQPEPRPVVADPFAKVVPTPLVAEVKKVEPQIAQQPEPRSVVANPFAKVVPLPLVADVKKVEPQTAQQMPPVQQPELKSVVTSSFPKTVSAPLFAEVKKVEPRTQKTLPTQQQESKPVVADPFAITSVDSQPKFAEVAKVEPQTAQQTPPALQPESKPVVANSFPKAVPMPLFAETKKTEPQTTHQSKPELVATDPFPKVVSPPLIAEVKKVEPRTQQTPPALQPEPKLVVAETKRPESLPKPASLPTKSPEVAIKDAPKPMPVQEEVAGFASSRRSTPRVAITDDPTTGFARSKK